MDDFNQLINVKMQIWSLGVSWWRGRRGSASPENPKEIGQSLLGLPRKHRQLEQKYRFRRTKRSETGN